MKDDIDIVREALEEFADRTGQPEQAFDRIVAENERLRGELKDYTQNGLWREWRQRALDSEATLDICAEEKAVLRADRDRLRRIEAGFRAVYEPSKGEDDWYNRRLPLIRDAQAALANQPAEEEASKDLWGEWAAKKQDERREGPELDTFH